MGRRWRLAKRGWSIIADLWTAKDILSAIFAYKIIAAVGTAIIGAVAIRAFTPMSFFDDTLITRVVGIILYFGLSAYESRTQRHAISVPFEKLADESLKKQASKWLTHKLSERRLHVRSAILFGSITHDHFATSDVDVIVCFDQMRDRQIATAVRHIKGALATDFSRTFGHKLHVTFFCAEESDDETKFLARQANPEKIL